MDKNEQAEDIAVLKQKVEDMDELNRSKYASSREFSDLTSQVNVQKETIRNLELRLNDFITSRKYMTATNISSLSLIVAVLSLFSHYLK